MRYKVYMAEVIHPDAEKKLRDFADVVDNFDHIEELDGILLRAHHLNREQISRAKKCKVIARHGVGMDILDVAACKEFGIPIVYTPGANTFSVAEFAFTMALTLMRNVYTTEYIQKTWGFAELGPVSMRGNEMRGKTEPRDASALLLQECSRALSAAISWATLLTHRPRNWRIRVSRRLRPWKSWLSAAMW